MTRLANRTWFFVLALVAPFTSALADGGVAAEKSLSALWSVPIGVGIGIAVAVFGASFAQGRIASSFMEGVSRNPGAQKQMFVPLILSLALVESLVLFVFLVGGNILSKVN